jgi:hypothetical protein
VIDVSKNNDGVSVTVLLVDSFCWSSLILGLQRDNDMLGESERGKGPVYAR